MAQTNWKSQRITIKDIARCANVDPSTVTRALQDSPRVKAATRKHIQSLAREMGYVPSVAARTLVMKRSKLVGVVIPVMSNPFFADMARGIQEEAEKADLRILILNTDGNPKHEQDAVKLFLELEVDGLLIPMARCPQSFYDRLDRSAPLIHINRPEAPLHVSCDMVGGTQMMMQHLFELGHRRIAFVNGPSGPVREPKMIAYRAALKEAGIRFDKQLVFQFDGTDASSKAIADGLLKLKSQPTAVFAWNDVCAIELIHALFHRGVEVPKDISVAGHDDILLAGNVLPPLTTVRWPMYDIGRESVRYLVSLRAEQSPRAPKLHQPSLVIRSSTGPAKN